MSSRRRPRQSRRHRRRRRAGEVRPRDHFYDGPPYRVQATACGPRSTRSARCMLHREGTRLHRHRHPFAMPRRPIGAMYGHTIAGVLISEISRCASRLPPSSSHLQVATHHPSACPPPSRSSHPPLSRALHTSTPDTPATRLTRLTTLKASPPPRQPQYRPRRPPAADIYSPCTPP